MKSCKSCKRQSRIYKSTCKQQKETYYVAMREDINNSKHSDTFWKALNRFRNSKFTKITNSIPDNRWYDHFKGVLEEFQDENRDVNGVEDTNPINDTAKNLQFILDNEITADEVKHAIKCLPKSKAVGTDGIPNEAYMNLDPTTLCYLVKALNKALQEEIPEKWGEIITAPIYKKNCKETPKTTGPITKLITSIISARIGHFCAIGEILSDNQCAYRRGKGCFDQVFNLYALICKLLSVPKGNFFAIFVDLSQAFDSITHCKLWKLWLRRLGLSENCTTRIQDLYKLAKTKVRTNNGFTSFINIKKGVLQGESCFSICLIYI
ncbi:unnamed protein product [Allacma fusca]|uniref:Reverse transcriptase domain-containing protein n=1 Tax=Allacma fusca TaxID=39272 RepID=A0A8J2PIV2_9HEXA|nr:unnamed protein product [Allacma fusca]